MTFGEKLVRLRKQRGLSQEQLAEKLKVSRQAVSRWESGSSPDMDNVVRIGRFFNCSLDYLLKEELTEDETAPPCPHTGPDTADKSPALYVLSASAAAAGILLALLVPLFAKMYQAFEYRNYHHSFTYASDYIFRFPILGIVLAAAVLMIAGAGTFLYLIQKKPSNRQKEGL